MKVVISLGLIFIILMMCVFAAQGIMAQYNPVMQAQGEQIRLEAQQAALDAEQRRIQAQAEWELRQAERERITNEMVASYKAALPWVMGIATITVCILIGMIGISIAQTVHGVGLATVVAANTAARLIRLDRRTGQFPIVLRDGMLIDPNTGMAMLTDQEHEPNTRMISAANSVRLAGVAINNTKVHMLGNNAHAGPMVAGAMQPKLSAPNYIQEKNDETY